MSPARRFEDKAVPGSVYEPRSAAALGREFPYRLATVCYFEVQTDGTVLWGGGRESYDRAVAGESRLFAVWPGEWSSHLFLIDDLEVFARAVGIVYDPKWTGLAEHRHEVTWSIREEQPKSRGAYVTVDVRLDCGCEILELDTFAQHLRDQQGWEVATSGAWGGSGGKHHVRVRRKSLGS
ncbi:hypothetical protein [Tenggerimyces flavus]|uniref:Uncharacterized protein n=1 Tax=Tenggerimyces flavus TaxID=1708749 RepID=A0ABV7YM58_9ACTN|nr:hypothetical protein [Tenggerimyces flavus]MBM7788731.1 hypothetical protein [Tenggerimyces flavus]